MAGSYDIGGQRAGCLVAAVNCITGYCWRNLAGTSHHGCSCAVALPVFLSPRTKLQRPFETSSTLLSLKLLSVILLTLAGSLLSETASAQLCNTTATPVEFGNYSPTSLSPNVSTGSISVSCRATVSIFIGFTIALSPGNSGNAASRRLNSGTGTLNYGLYTSSGYSQTWGNGTDGTATMASGYLLQALVPITFNFSVYGRIPARQNVSPGSYTDSVLISVTY